MDAEGEERKVRLSVDGTEIAPFPMFLKLRECLKQSITGHVSATVGAYPVYFFTGLVVFSDDQMSIGERFQKSLRETS